MRKKRNKKSVHKQKKKNTYPPRNKSKVTPKQEGDGTTKKVSSDTSTDDDYQIKQEMEIAKSCFSMETSEYQDSYHIR